VAPSDEAALPDEAAIRQWLIDGDTARAERALLARLAASPLESSSWWLLGETRRRAGQASEAVTASRRVIELGNPSEANRARYQVALLLEERLGDAEGAITLYRAYLARSPRPLEAAAQLRLGRLLGSRGDAAARSILEELVRLHPGTPEAEQATSVLDGR
jgi:tetratricopeptide (TPR) repeat protein